ncbi:RraA family protein [Microbacterium sp. NPDC055910]|uniref:RraA family protein n=1 Tax=Microbacterium sp. NPDC055910 TaxID=3345659 RepID=UPI0035E354AF
MSLLDRYATLETSAVSDALDSLSLLSGVGGLLPLTVDAPVIGYARTAQLEPRHQDVLHTHILTEVVDAAGEDDVLVVDNDGRTDVAAWGGILGLGASLRGVRGIIIDGAMRDVQENRRLDLAVYARGTVPASARGRLQQRTAGEPVHIAGRVVHEGDLVFADPTGFVVVPRAHIDTVLRQAETVVARRRAISDDVRNGLGLRDTMTDARLAGTERPANPVS